MRMRSAPKVRFCAGSRQRFSSRRAGCPHFTDARLAPGSGYPESMECGYQQRFSSYCPCLAGQGVAFSPVVDRLSRFLMISAPGHFHLHLISDSTGETLITVARAAAAQYSRIMPVEHVHPLVRTQKQLDRVLVEIEETPGIVLYTLLEENLVARLEQKCRALGLPCLSILGPVLHLF